jgi:predicted dehydrogenase
MSNYHPRSFDLLIIASENKRHLDDYFLLNIFAKKILIEKPLLHRNLNDVEVNSLMERESDIFISSPLRFHQGFVELLRNREAIGETSNIEARCQSWLPDWRPWRNYREGFWNDPVQGGVLREIVHELDYLIRVFGTLDPVYSSMSHSKFLLLDVESSIDAFLRTPNLVHLNVHLDYSSAISRRYFRMDGSNGSLQWDILKGELSINSNRNGAKVQVFENDLNRNMTFQRQIESILNPRSWPVSATNLKEGLSALQLIDKIYSIAKK